MKRWMIGLVIVSIGVVLVFGAEKTWSYLTAGREAIQDEVGRSAPMGLEATRIRALIQAKNDEILRHEEKVADLQSRAEAAAKTLEETRRKLEAERGLLARIKEMLDSRQDRYTVGGNTYTHAEINADAIARVDACRKLQADIDEQSLALSELRKAVGQGQATAGDARHKLKELAQALNRMEARNANADLRLELAQITAGITATPVGQNSELERAVNNYERRVAGKERRASVGLGVGESALINYDKTAVAQDASVEIERFLTPRQAPPTSPATTRPSAGGTSTREANK